MFNDHVVARRVRTRVPRQYVPSIARALTAATAVPADTLYPYGTDVVVGIINQHASNDGLYAPLYPAPPAHANDPDGDLFDQPTGDMTCEVWQFTYTDGVVHAHISLHDVHTDSALCVTPFRARGHAMLTTTSRRPARAFKSTPVYAPESGLAAFERYLFLRDNRAVRGWNFADPKDIDAAARADGGPVADPDWERELAVPGFDFVADMTNPYLDATYTLHRK